MPLPSSEILTVIKLIRSKGVGIFFCTQNPQDIPAGVLAQLGLKIQHALRAFTAADRKSIKQASENYPETEYYDIDNLMTQLGTGEAFVALLNEKGIPSPLVHTMLIPPSSRMDVLTAGEITDILAKSKLKKKYETEVDSESAYEILNSKLQEASERTPTSTNSEGEEKRPAGRSPKPEKSTLEKVLESSVTRQIGRTAASIITRGLLGALGLGGRSRKRSIF